MTLADEEFTVMLTRSLHCWIRLERWTALGVLALALCFLASRSAASAAHMNQETEQETTQETKEEPPEGIPVAETENETESPSPSPEADEVAGSELPAPRPLDHEAYDRWNSIRERQFSADGEWVAYTLRPTDDDADATLHLHEVDGTRRYEVVRGTRPRFSHDGRFAVYLVEPDPEAVKAAKKEQGDEEAKKNDDALPKNKLEILELDTGAITTIARVNSFQVPEKAGGALAYLLEPPVVEEDTEPAAKQSEAESGSEATGAPGEEGTSVGAAAESQSSNPPPGELSAQEPPAKSQQAGAEGAAQKQESSAGPSETQKSEGGEATGEAQEEKEGEEEKDENVREKPGTTLVIRQLATGAEHRFEHASNYGFDEQGTRLYYLELPPDKRQDKVHVVHLGTTVNAVIADGKGEYQAFTFSEDGHQLAFLSTRDDAEAEEPRWSLYHWDANAVEAGSLVDEQTPGMPEHWGVSQHRGPRFSKSGARLLLGTAPLPPREEDEEPAESSEGSAEGAGEQPAAAEGNEEEEEDEEKKVVVDIWHWQDPLLQPMQLQQREQEEQRDYLAYVELSSGSFVQLGTETIPEVSIANHSDGAVAVGHSNLDYRREISWDWPRFYDVYLIDVATGDSEQVLERFGGRGSLSPLGKYLTWYDRVEQDWFARNVENGQTVNLTEMLPHPTHDELDDHPWLVGPYGTAGWAGDDQTFLVYDRFDVWGTNPEGFFPPFCLTDGFGRENELRLRYVRLDPEEDHVPADDPLLFSSFDEQSKEGGFYRDTLRSNDPPQRLFEQPERLSTPTRADEADRLLLTRQTFRRYPDLWVTDSDFDTWQRISTANPQQSEYRWGTSELFEWTSLHGDRLQGILHKPDDFDAAQQYPLLVYFYERNSHNLHQYVAPAPGSSSINRSFYVSRGYLVFVPDIPYRIGYPGESAESAILPGVARLIDQGFVDPERIGVQGHSWGGYQVAHLVTRTNLFACAEAGAPVSNMTSAYGGIRWGTGMSRMFQYERSQSRIGGTLWEALPRYLENSPLFHADKIETPLLMLHNDEDGAVPWYQGIELFVAMRRLDKPCWMLNYNGEAHGLRQDHNRRDWTIRLQQFFDHYLLDAPPPVWLAQGVPAVDKGDDLGLELVGAEGEADR